MNRKDWSIAGVVLFFPLLLLLASSPSRVNAALTDPGVGTISIYANWSLSVSSISVTTNGSGGFRITACGGGGGTGNSGVGGPGACISALFPAGTVPVGTVLTLTPGGPGGPPSSTLFIAGPAGANGGGAGGLQSSGTAGGSGSGGGGCSEVTYSGGVLLSAAGGSGAGGASPALGSGGGSGVSGGCATGNNGIAGTGCSGIGKAGTTSAGGVSVIGTCSTNGGSGSLAQGGAGAGVASGGGGGGGGCARYGGSGGGGTTSTSAAAASGGTGPSITTGQSSVCIQGTGASSAFASDFYLNTNAAAGPGNGGSYAYSGGYGGAIVIDMCAKCYNASVPPCSDILECASNPCQNGGTCLEGVGTCRYDCTCKAGYSGAQCQTNINECASTPCQNGGTCTDLVNSYSCACRSGYYGSSCQYVDSCISTPCQNGATCNNTQSSFACACTNGYNGTLCATRSYPCLHTPNPCMAGGTCTETPGSGLGYTCACVAGVFGNLCQFSTGCGPNTKITPVLGGTCKNVTLLGPSGATQVFYATAAIGSAGGHAATASTAGTHPNYFAGGSGAGAAVTTNNSAPVGTVIRLCAPTGGSATVVTVYTDGGPPGTNPDGRGSGGAGAYCGVGGTPRIAAGGGGAAVISRFEPNSPERIEVVAAGGGGEPKICGLTTGDYPKDTFTGPSGAGGCTSGQSPMVAGYATYCTGVVYGGNQTGGGYTFQGTCVTDGRWGNSYQTIRTSTAWTTYPSNNLRVQSQGCGADGNAVSTDAATGGGGGGWFGGASGLSNTGTTGGMMGSAGGSSYYNSTISACYAGNYTSVNPYVLSDPIFYSIANTYSVGCGAAGYPNTAAADGCPGGAIIAECISTCYYAKTINSIRNVAEGCSDVLECASNPCQNGGTCNEGVGTCSYTCSCIGGFTGMYSRALVCLCLNCIIAVHCLSVLFYYIPHNLTLDLSHPVQFCLRVHFSSFHIIFRIFH